MLLRIRHEVSYHYDAPVFLERQALRFRPRCDHTQQLRDFGVTIDPEPMLLSDGIDLEGNETASAWFVDTTDHLSIVAEAEVETLQSNPFSYMLSDVRARLLPVAYPPELEPGLAPYCANDHDASLQRLAQLLSTEAGQQSLPFLMLLTERVPALCALTYRETGQPQLPAETLERGQGACRDLATLFIAVCQAVGFAARFVSGYRHIDDAGDEAELHAWAEVYVPGGGWRGYDPSAGLAVADQHVSVAASWDPARTLPVIGTFRGTGVSATVSYAVTSQSFNQAQAQSSAAR